MSSRGTKTPDPRKSNLAKKYSQSSQGITTVMIRNIPKEYAQDELIEEVSTIMGHEPFDFFYLPWDFQNNTNVGYAFVNFHRSKSAHLAMKIFAKYRFKLHTSPKLGDASPAHIQGLENNLRHLEHRAVVHENHPCSPVVMWKGEKIEISVIFQVMRGLDSSSNRVKAPRSMLVAGSNANPAHAHHTESNIDAGFEQLLDMAVGISPDDSGARGSEHLIVGVPGANRAAMNLGGMQAPDHLLPGGMGQMPLHRGGAGVEDIFEQDQVDTYAQGAPGLEPYMRAPEDRVAPPMSWPMQSNAQRNYNTPGNAPPYIPAGPVVQESSQEGVEARGYSSMTAAEETLGPVMTSPHGNPAYVSLPRPAPSPGGAIASTLDARPQQPPPGLGSDPLSQYSPPDRAAAPAMTGPKEIGMGKAVREIRAPSGQDAMAKFMKKFDQM